MLRNDSEIINSKARIKEIESSKNKEEKIDEIFIEYFDFSVKFSSRFIFHKRRTINIFLISLRGALGIEIYDIQHI